jgi:hypothetical protein
MIAQVLTLETGKKHLRRGTVVSTGPQSDGDFVSLDTDGRLNPSVMPVGMMSAVVFARAIENLHSGDFVNLYDSGDEKIVRMARANFEAPASGFVLQACAAGELAEIWCENRNTQMVNVSKGARYYLSVTHPGKAVVEDAQSVSGGLISQYIGVGVSDTHVDIEIDDHILIANYDPAVYRTPTPLEPAPVSVNTSNLYPFIPFVSNSGARADMPVGTGLVDFVDAADTASKINLIKSDGSYLPFIASDLSVSSVPVVFY